MRTLMVVALVFALAMSGCLAKKDKDDDGTSSTQTSTSSGSSTGTGAPGPNHAPAGSMKANSTGIAPANVTFVINATDADGDAMTWNLTFGDGQAANGSFQRRVAVNGSVVPTGVTNATNLTHLYAAAGLYNATLTVSDGKAVSNVTLRINITAGTPFEQFVASGTPDLSCTQCTEGGANTGIGYRAGINELDSWFVTIPETAAGQPFTLTSTEGDPEVSFRTTCASAGTAVEGFNAEGPEAGIVPAGALCALTWEYAGPGSTITLTIG